MIFVVLVLMLILAVWRPRLVPWIYGAFIVYALLWLPYRAHFHLRWPECEGIPTLAMAFYSLGNYQHVILMTAFFVITYATLVSTKRPMLWSALAVALMGFAVEIEEGMTRFHHCRMRDLIPDMAGALAGAILILIWKRVRREPRS